MDDPQGTPPNWPICGVNFSEHQIFQIAQCVYPRSKLVLVSELEKRKSFNNRIYFLTLEHAGGDNARPKHTVLKIPGRFFGASKIQNEVAVLLLVAKYCPEIPAPRVLAWSEDGSKISAIQNGVFAVLHDEAIDGGFQPKLSHGWIMLSKLPGRPLSKEELIPINHDLASQLAKIVVAWRTQIPRRDDIGNLVLKPAGNTSSYHLHGLETIVSGLVLSETQPTGPLNTEIDFYDHSLRDQVYKLDTDESFAAMRSDLKGLLDDFRAVTLPQLLSTSCCSGMCIASATDKDQPIAAVFTHQDFAPRNILVSSDVSNAGKLLVTGILDFEFAGFFPETEEFLTCISIQSDDWEQEFLGSLLEQMSILGASIPGKGVNSDHFQIVSDLALLVANVAPWQLESGHYKGEELEIQLREAKNKVLSLMERLQSIVASECHSPY